VKNKFLQIFYIVTLLFVIFFWPSRAISQYRVSGVVEFTYRNLETKTGNSVTSDIYWTQTYRANLQGDLFDPRFMRFSGGAGYSVYTYKNASDSTMVDYNLNTAFFPGMKVSWDLFGNKSVRSVETATSIAGYDVTTTSYGGTLNLRLGSSSRNGNNRNNNSGSSMQLPDITLSRRHTESESQSITSPLHETRDDTRATVNYGIGSSVSLNLDGSIEDYENLANNSSYESKTANLTSNIRVSPDAELKLTGHLTDRATQNISGLEASEKAQTYNAILDFKETNGLHHYYRYDFIDQKTSSSEFTSNRGEARVIYRIRDEWRIQGGLDYSLSDYARKPNLTDPGEKTSLETGGLLTGVLYRKKYTPAFMGPFSFDTGYDFNTGFSNLTSETGGPEGSGWYYTNNVSLGINSTGWGKENLNFTYSYNNRRDGSPLQNDMWQHSYRFLVTTRRISNTKIHGSASYISQEYRSEAGSIFLTTSLAQQSINQQRRSLTYDLTAEHYVSASLSLAAGAVRGQSTSTVFTLSTLPSKTVSEDLYYYGAANFTYLLTRNLFYRAQLREEYRTSLSTDTQSHQMNMFLDYRIRQIFVNVEYRLRVDAPENTTRSTQQYYYVKLSRPF
jgi:hypothetical protein